jgi:hypothetical protein
MQSAATSTEAYLHDLPADRRAVIDPLLTTIRANLPTGVVEGMQYGMIGWFVPHSVFPAGYHCDPKQPVPYVHLANQKGAVSLYLFCMYVDEPLPDWFRDRYQQIIGKKPDMGKSCVRFKRPSDVPLELIGETLRRAPLETFLEHYQAQIPASARKQP